jgi:choline kinase
MRNKDNCIISPKQSANNENELITFIIFEKQSNSKLKSVNFPFIKVHGKPLLEKQIETIQSVYKNFEIIFVCGKSYLKAFDYLKKYQGLQIRLIENSNFEQTNCCESIRIALTNTFNNKVLVLPEDILLSSNTFKFLDMKNSSIFVHENINDNNIDVGTIHENFKLESLTIGIKQNYWSEMLFLHSEKILKDFKELLFMQNYESKLLFEAINQLNYKHKIKVINIPNCVKLNNIKILKRINNEGIN